MQTHLKLIGSIMIFLSFIHLVFPKYFNWKGELAALSLINRQIMYIHTFFLALSLLLMGILCIVASNHLATTALGSIICLGLGIFWLTRLVIQFVGYSSKLWKGKIFETTIHILFLLVWSYISSVLFFTYWFNKAVALKG